MGYELLGGGPWHNTCTYSSTHIGVLLPIDVADRLQVDLYVWFRGQRQYHRVLLHLYRLLISVREQWLQLQR